MSRKHFRAFATALALTALLSTTGCIIPDTEDKKEQLAETNDPLEPMNRYFFELDLFLQEIALKPAAAWYQAALPQPAQNAVHKFLANLRLPWTAINDMLQWQPGRAGTAAMRFAINSTVGVAGLFDVATDWGYPQHDEDLGQTFAVWGVPEGPYLVLPVFGPSNPRDAVGMFGDWHLDPVNIFVTNNFFNAHPRDPDETEYKFFTGARGFGEALDQQARNGQAMDELKKQSMDFYATIRSVWRQRREALIQNRGESDSPYPSPRGEQRSQESAVPGGTSMAGPRALPDGIGIPDGYRAVVLPGPHGMPTTFLIPPDKPQSPIKPQAGAAATSTSE